VLTLHSFAAAQHFSRSERAQAEEMLKNVAADVRDYYYDPAFHGVAWEAAVQEAKAQIAKANSYGEAFVQIEALVEKLRDSHTFFVPPHEEVDYGLRFQMIGEHCYVTQVKPGSDAASQGIKPGDEIATIAGFTPARDSLWRLKLATEVLTPMDSLEFGFLDGSARQLRKVIVKSHVRPTKTILDLRDMTGLDQQSMRLRLEEEQRLMRIRTAEFGRPLIVIKLPVFVQDAFAIEGVIDKARAHDTLILDLRGTPGGAVDSVRAWLDYFFSRDLKFADCNRRGKSTSEIAKTQHNHVFGGKLIVLMDSSSASGAEVLARVIQLEKRGIVLGDLSAGATMGSRLHGHRTGVYTYATSVTDADLRMNDGKGIEGIGVTPDEKVLPSARDLREGFDPAMSRAAEMAGVKLSPEEAGKLFPYEWPKE
jgi:C-terminal processing protease CtpA/Prc